MAAEFPQRREDGSFSVAARMSASDSWNVELARNGVEQWTKSYAATHRTDPLSEFLAAPRVETRTDTSFDIVFDAGAHSRLWRELMVDLVKQLTSESNTVFVGFYDRVANRPHPGWPTQT